MTDFPPPGGGDAPEGQWVPPAPPPPPPPGAVPYPTSAYGPSYGVTYTAGAPRFASLSALTTGLTVLFTLAAGAAILAATAFFNRASVLGDFGAGLDIVALGDADDSVRRASGLLSLLYIATFVVLIIWQFRHAQNAEKLRGPLALGPGWAIGGWFIPIANLFLPAAQIAQSAKASDRAGRMPRVVVLWALLLAIAGIFYAAGSVTRPGNDGPVTAFNVRQSISDFQRADRLSAAGLLFGIGAAASGVVMVRTLSSRQREAVEAITGAG